MTASHRSRTRAAVSRPIRPRAEALERRRLMTAYLPAVADYDGDGVADIATFRVGTTSGQRVYGKDSLLMQLSKSATLTGYEMGYASNDVPTPADFDGDGKADPAVYGFLDASGYEDYYATTTTPFPTGTGRFAYIPSSGVYPTHNAGAVNGAMGLINAKVIAVNIGGAGDLPAVADYDRRWQGRLRRLRAEQGAIPLLQLRDVQPQRQPDLARQCPERGGARPGRRRPGVGGLRGGRPRAVRRL